MIGRGRKITPVESPDPFTHRVIGLAMEIHRVLGAGLEEEFYHHDFSSRLTSSGMPHLSKPRRDLIYRGTVADTFEPDIVFEDRLIVELKSLISGFDSEHFTQVIGYQKFWRIRTAVLIDFGKPSLAVKRVAYSSKTSEFLTVLPPEFSGDRSLANDLIATANDCVRDIGLGYRKSTWVGVFKAALIDRSLPFVLNPTAGIASLGLGGLKCFVLGGRLAVGISALGDGVTAVDRAYLQTCLRWLDLPWGIVFHFGKDRADLRFVTRPKSS